MPLLLVLHDLGTPPAEAPGEAEEDFFYTFFGVAPDHWRLAPGATLVGTDLSPRYLLQHLRQTAQRCGLAPRLLLVTPMPEEVAALGLTPEGEAWMREMRA
jgi:hypothetical protein